MSIFSFFAGAGFLDLGFESQGFNPVFVNECNAEFLHAYKHSRAVLGLKKADFGYSSESFETFFHGRGAAQLSETIERARARGLIGFIGGPPCPDFSIGGKNRGRNGEHGRLTGLYLKLIRKHRPDWFLFENVKGLWKTKRHRDYYERLKKTMLAAGYALSERLINAIEYGAPQDRERVILLGFRDTLCAQVGLTPGKVVTDHSYWENQLRYDRRNVLGRPWPSKLQLTLDSGAANSAIPNELTIAYWFKRNSVTTHPNAKHAFKPRAGLARFNSVKEGDDSRKSYKRLHRFRYSPTACYGNNEVHIHPFEPRRITVAEALAVQSLPADFELPANMSLSAMFKTIGNGVPFLAAIGLAATVKQYLGHCVDAGRGI